MNQANGMVPVGHTKEVVNAQMSGAPNMPQ